MVISKAIDCKQLKVTSPVFKENEIIPDKYTCDDTGTPIPLNIKCIPKAAKCLAIIVDAPGDEWLYWIAWNIPVTDHIRENHVYGTAGSNDFHQYNYTRWQPTPGTHPYYFKVYALDTLIDLQPGTTKPQLEKAICDHIIAFGELVGLYKK